MIGWSVWIEPLWNWNLCWQIERADGICLNWTFMELKFEQRIARRCDMGFELNLYGIEISNFDYVTFSEIVWIEPLWNWNIITLSAFNTILRVWIEPLWNWNFPKLQGLWNPESVWIEPLWNWNPFKDEGSLNAVLVWIEPLWNWNSV